MSILTIMTSISAIILAILAIMTNVLPCQTFLKLIIFFIYFFISLILFYRFFYIYSLISFFLCISTAYFIYLVIFKLI